jgi:effector-binding domain-containing protein
MRGMFKVVDKIMRELRDWLRQNGVEPCGPPFLRYYVIDMAGEMDIEAGVPVTAEQSETVPLPGGSRVQPGILPAGRYASLIYSGSGYNGNRALVEWARANGVAWDRWEDPRGDAFRCRYERYLTDPKVEPRKTLWQIEVAIKVLD